MARVGRLAGAILAESGGDYFLVGNTKEPCDFRAFGFEPPAGIDAIKRRFIQLRSCRPIEIGPPHLKFQTEGQNLAQILSERLLIERNGSVSERLWKLLLDPSGESSCEVDEVDSQWLAEIPAHIWEIVRDTVLRCL